MSENNISNNLPQVNDINNDYTTFDDLSMFTVNNSNNPLTDIDPDLNALNEIEEGLILSNKIYTESSFNLEFNEKDKGLSILNTNIRSMLKNLSNIELVLQSFNQKFALIACTENRLKESNANIYNLENYSHEFNIQTKKQGAGVLLFIRNNVNYIIRKDFKMSKQFSCIAIEILKESINYAKNLIIVFIYRH